VKASVRVRGPLLASISLTIATAAVTLLLLAASHPSQATAAPCPAPTVLNLSGNVSISGTTPCDDDPERFSVFCGGGHAKFDYYVNDTFVATVDTGTACGAVARFSVDGRYGDDLIDLSRVSAADGFTGMNLPNIITGGAGADLLVGAALPNSVSGGSGNDIVIVRNGVPDMADCGTEIDAVQTDQSGVDSLTSCELVDPLPTAATPAAPAPTTPKKKCKKKHGHKKCKKRRATRR
jgi:hypothetical protein